MAEEAKMGIQQQINQLNGYDQEMDDEEEEEEEDENNYSGGQNEMYNPLRHKNY